MANRWYLPWVNDGKPYRAARPIAEVVARLKAARPAAARLNLFGSIGDLAHLTATVPRDHTPYSQTGWPDPSPYGIGFATDIMHRPDLDLNCFEIFEHWIGEARAGRLPWLKYLIWRGQIYAVWDDWEPDDAEGHYDHIHASARTDYVDAGIGDFDPLGGDVNTAQNALLYNASSISASLARMTPTAPILNPNGTKGTPVELKLVTAVLGIQAQLTASAAREQAHTAAINALASMGGVDAAPIVAEVRRVGDELGGRLAKLETDNEALRAEVDLLQRQLAEAAEREADAARAVLAAGEPDVTPA